MSNSNYDKYLDMLMRNHTQETDSQSDESGQVGSASSRNDGSQPFGGFPPINLCSKTSLQSAEETKAREYSTHKSAVSIKDIMKKRREVTPFIST